ncbi:MAG: Rpp14/Pop5 family protein [Candidatus Woesearchaeota archaeon]
MRKRSELKDNFSPNEWCYFKQKKNMKLKPILPSLREKKRYVVFEIISKTKIDFTAASKAIWNSILNFAGTKGAAEAGIWVMNDKFNKEKQKGIIKTSHKSIDLLKAALALIKEIEGKAAIVRSIAVSGILNKAEKRID